MSQYFSDREFGPVPRTLDELPPGAWAGIVGALRRFFARNYFAGAFPEQCPDRQGIAGTDSSALLNTLVGHIPLFDHFPRASDEPDTPDAMDLVEFAWRYLSEPSQGTFHRFYEHHHLRGFDAEAGRAEWREEINTILSRHGVQIELSATGRAERIGPLAAQEAFERPLQPTGDQTLDDLLASAMRKFRSTDPIERCESLQPLWDALERVKTVLDSDKRRGVERLIALITTDEAARETLQQEFRTLTNIGNKFEIRHHETSAHPVPDELVDPLFLRAFVLLNAASLALARERE